MTAITTHGNVLCELVVERTMSDGADADPMVMRKQITYKIMSNGYVLVKRDVWIDLGVGSGFSHYPGTWKREGKINRELMEDIPKLHQLMSIWAENLLRSGWQVELRR